MGVKVKMRDLPRGASPEAHDRAFKGMMAAFKREVNEAGILQDLSKKKFYESKGRKNRRKRKENAALRRKEERQASSELRERSTEEWPNQNL
jgi:ribosomal protein S21